MYLNELFEDAPHIEITGITTDTRYIKPGYLFVPLKGLNFDEGDFIIEAVQNGAVAILGSRAHFNTTLPVIVRKNNFEELKRILKLFYGKTWEELTMIGVTGTDGKTTLSFMANYLINQFSSCAYIGTNGIIYKDQKFKNFFTTPPLSENYRLFRTIRDEGIKCVAMEVSSQGIANHRIEDFQYDYAVFTNLTHEHLDTHKTMENYFLTKLELFKQVKPNGTIIVNNDDEYAPRFSIFQNVITYGIYNFANYRAINIRYGNKYTTFDLQTPSCILKNLKVTGPKNIIYIT
jgi:UDP-N-acetylmuramoyl-L-alanyl-D-glutamate--2,6-diaminopimelate ligase